MTAVLERHPPLSADDRSHVDAYLAALAGYWLDICSTPDPNAPRDFQQRSAAGALELLRRRL
jgi:hypothetical protein